MKYNIVSDAGLYKRPRQKLFSIAEKSGYEIVEINLEADYKVLQKRFDERVKLALATPDRKISNLSKKRFKELFDIFQSEKNPSVVTFKTDEHSPEEVSKKIMRFL